MAQTTPRSIGPLAAAAGAIGLWLAAVWVANQGDFIPDSATAAQKAFGTIFQAVRSMPILLAVWVGALGIGLPLRTWLAPGARHPITLQICLGMGAMLMLDWLLAACGWMNAWTAFITCGIGTAIITYHYADPATRERWHPDHWPSPPWSLLLALPALGFLLVACTIPPGVMWRIEALGYDVTSYHLQVPREWLLRGQMQQLTHNIYSHLPMLAEASFMKLAAMHQGTLFDAVYTIQFFHASAGILAAVVLGRLVTGWVGPVAGAVSGAAMLAMPWTLITGSMAYSEMFVMLFGAAALMAMFDPHSRTPRGALVAGLFAGLAAMAKLTALGFIVLPVAIVLFVRTFYPSNAGQINRRHAMVPMAMFALGTLLILAPYLIRNAIWTGNPVFPFATSLLGAGHWTDDQVTRWNNAHHSQGISHGISELPRQWLLNTGYGAIGGTPVHQNVTDVARFDAEYGLPLFWIVAGIGIMLMAITPGLRGTGLALLLFLIIQLLFWLLLTHHQSRFLIPTLLPGCILIGIAVARIAHLSAGKRDWLAPLISITLLASLTATSYQTLLSQTPRFIDPETGQAYHFPIYQLVDSLIDPADVTTNQPDRLAGNHLLNGLPATSRTILVGDATGLFYIQRQFLYNTAFDRSAFAKLSREHKNNLTAMTISLVRSGFTHVWINLAELDRLHHSYGLEPELAPDNIRDLLKAIDQSKIWQRLDQVAGTTVPSHVAFYALPPIRTPATPATPPTP